MTSFQRFFSKVLASLMLAGLSFVFVSSVKGQCPTDIAPTSSIWIGPTTVTIPVPGTSCHIDIKYCYRTLPDGTDEYYIEEIDPKSSDCDNVTWAAIITAAREYFFQTEQGHSCDPSNPCSGPLITSVSVFTATCAKMHLTSCGTCSPTAVCIFCSGAYCAKTCGICHQSDGTNLECNCTFTTLGSGDCTTAPDGWPNITVTYANSAGYYDHCYINGTCSN